jgi:hypothetical protein
MQSRNIGIGWQKTLWKIVSNPTIEVVAAIVVVLFSAWFVVETEVDLRGPTHLPIPFGHK